MQRVVLVCVLRQSADSIGQSICMCSGGSGGGGGGAAPPRQSSLIQYAAYNYYTIASFAHHLCAAHA